MSQDQQDLRIRVTCYAGQRADEEPRSFFLGEREITIHTILDRWLDPDYRYFKVRGSDDGIYILRHDIVHQRWELTMYDSGGRDDTRLSSS